MDEKQRIEQLRRELHEHNYRYYVQNQPTIEATTAAIRDCLGI